MFTCRCAFITSVIVPGVVACHTDQFPDDNVVHPTVKVKRDKPMTVKNICCL